MSCRLYGWAYGMSLAYLVLALSALAGIWKLSILISTSDLHSLQQFLVDQPNIPKEECWIFQCNTSLKPTIRTYTATCKCRGISKCSRCSYFLLPRVQRNVCEGSVQTHAQRISKLQNFRVS